MDPEEASPTRQEKHLTKRKPGFQLRGDLKGPGPRRHGSDDVASFATSLDLVEAGHEVEIFEARNFVGGKVGSWIDKDGNHIEMGLHVFFGCYYNLFGILQRIGTFEKSMRLKDHQHIFVNKGGTTGALDFRMGGIGAPFNGLKAFAVTEQLGAYDKLMNAVRLGTSPIVRALVDFVAIARVGCIGALFSGWGSANHAEHQHAYFDAFYATIGEGTPAQSMLDAVAGRHAIFDALAVAHRVPEVWAAARVLDRVAVMSIHVGATGIRPRHDVRHPH